MVVGLTSGGKNCKVMGAGKVFLSPAIMGMEESQSMKNYELGSIDELPKDRRKVEVPVGRSTNYRHKRFMRGKSESLLTTREAYQTPPVTIQILGYI